MALNFLSKIAGWFKETLSEPSGTGSSSRLALLLIVATGCGVLICHVTYTHALPSKEQLDGLAGFVGLGTGAYIANKLKS